MKIKYSMYLGAVFMALMSSCAAGESGEQPPRSVATVRVGSAGIAGTEVFSGIVREKADVSVAFKTPGQLEHIYVKEGDYVHRGQVLARLDCKDYLLGVEAAQAQYDQLSRELSRMEILLEAKSISVNDYEKARYGLDQLRVQLQNNKNKVEYTTLCAPSDGYIERVNFEPAEMVDAGTPVFNLIMSGPMKVELNVPGSFYDRRDRIRSINVCADGVTAEASVLSILPKADATQLYRMLLSVGTSGLTPGKNVEVRFDMDSDDDAGRKITVPAAAVINREGRTWVWVLKPDSTVERREVSTGADPADGRMVIEKGLNGDEEIVRAGANSLCDGEKVQVLAPVSKTNIGGLL